MGEDGRWWFKTLDHLEGLADPVEADRGIAVVAECPLGTGGQIGEGAGAQRMVPAVIGDRAIAVDDENAGFGARISGSGFTLQPPGVTSMMYCAKVSAKGRSRGAR